MQPMDSLATVRHPCSLSVMVALSMVRQRFRAANDPETGQAAARETELLARHKLLPGMTSTTHGPNQLVNRKRKIGWMRFRTLMSESNDSRLSNGALPRESRRTLWRLVR